MTPRETAPKSGRTSALEIRTRFATPEAAARYSTALEGTRRHRRETACIRRGLRAVPPGAAVLDLPCGTGRLLPFLTELGYRVTAADSSPHMAAHARKRDGRTAYAGVVVASVFDTGFRDDAFDAVVCNRLFHHFREPETRQRALKELGRICSGTIVVSFFCNRALDAWRFYKNALRRKKATDRIPIPFHVFAGDIACAGLEIVEQIATWPGVSPQCYLALRKTDTASPAPGRAEHHGGRDETAGPGSI